MVYSVKQEKRKLKFWAALAAYKRKESRVVGLSVVSFWVPGIASVRIVASGKIPLAYSNKALHSTIYKLVALWSRCRSTLPQCAYLINCE